jgi:hypothetical protein
MKARRTRKSLRPAVKPFTPWKDDAMKKMVMIVVGLGLLTAHVALAAKTVEEKLKELEKRVQKVEVKAGTDRLKLTGDFRFEAHSISSSIPDHVDGMMFQSQFVDALAYLTAGGMPPMTLEDIPAFMQGVGDYIGNNFGDYYAFTQTVTFADVQNGMQMLGQLPPEVQQAIMQGMAQAAFVEGYDWDNDIFYTNRLRLDMQADVADNVNFAGRLAMYKPWGESTGVQVFNGQPNSINIDGTTASVPNSDIVRVERAYFNWMNIGGSDIYLSIGRRPSTGGPPLHLRQDEPRGGTPLGLVVDYQFDGITAGWHLGDKSTFRLCYGLGYESGFGSAEQLRQPADRMKDTHFFGLNWDVLNTEKTYVQATALRAFDVTDGFNGLVVLPTNPVTGKPVGAPVVMRFTPSSNLGDLDLASLVLLREEGAFDLFASYSVIQSHPEDVTTPFGGMFADPFETPAEQDGSMVYLGARYSLPNDKTRIGLEFNHGSKYWFNFAIAADDIIAPKTNTRGNVWEAYVTHRINKKLIVKLDYIHYDYEYSGSGWHLGAPKKLDDKSPPVLGFPTYDSADKVALSFMARF